MTCLLLIGLAGCAPKVPSKVTADEYEVYSAWLRHHFANKQPDTLYLMNRTFSWPPSCTVQALIRDGGDYSLIRRLLDLGEAEYPLNLYNGSIKIPWAFEETGFPQPFPTGKPGTFRIITFSRVAFNATHTRALFAVSNACGGLCGGGGALLGQRDKGAWVFKPTGCAWVY